MFISTFVIAAIIVFQLIWLKKVYHYEQKQFDHNIARALRGFFIASPCRCAIASPRDE